MRLLTVGLTAILLSAFFAHAAPVLYTGEMVVKKVSGKDCTGKEAGRTKPASMIIDNVSGTITGYLWGNFATGRFSGKDANTLDLRYAYLNPLLGEGHSITLAEQGERLTAIVKERQLASDQEGCNWENAELKLARSTADAALAWKKAEARYTAHSYREQGIVLYKQKKYAEAIPLYEKALAMREEADGTTAEPVSWYLKSLVYAYANAGRLEDAQKLLDEGLKRFPSGDSNKDLQETRGWLQTKQADNFFNQARALEDKRKYTQAIPLYIKALEIDRRIRPKFAAADLLSLANSHKELQQWHQAEGYYKESIALIEKEFGLESKELASALNHLATMYVGTGRYSEAESIYKQALVTAEKTLGREHAHIASLLFNLAELHLIVARYSEAESFFKKTIEIEEKIYGSESFQVVNSRIRLAALYRIVGRYTDAEFIFVSSISVLEKKSGATQEDLANALNSLAVLYDVSGRYAEAEPLFKRSLKIYEEMQGQNSIKVALLLRNIAKLYNSTGRYTEAELLHIRALAIYENKLGPEHPDVADSCNSIGSLLINTGRYAAAETLYKRALSIRENKLGPEHPDVAISLNNLAGLLKTTGRYTEAEPLYKRALAIGEKTLGPEHALFATILNNLAVLYVDGGRYNEAEPLYKRALAITKKALGPEHPDVAGRLNNLAMLYLEQQKYTEATTLHIRSLCIANNAGEPDLLSTVQNNYSWLLEEQKNAEAAIFFGKQAVNTIQGMRKNVAGLGKDTLKSFDAKVEETYRRLSRLLVAQGRLPEAERVLELLKEQEQFQFVRRDAKLDDLAKGRAPMTSFEAAQDKLLADAGAPLAAIYAEMVKLEEKKQRTPAEEKRLKELTARHDTAKKAFASVLEQVVANLSVARADKAEGLKDEQGIQATLADLGEGTVALYTIVDKDSYTLILTTPDYRRAYTVPVKELAAKIATFRSIVTNPALDPRPTGKELLEIILPTKAREELKQAKAQTLMWHLDGPLRYLPISALHDGKQYLVEQFRITAFTTAGRDKLKDQPKAAWKGLGLGVSEQRTVLGKQFAALASVPGELATVIKQSDSQGIIPGEQYLNAEFTWQTMQQKLRRKGSYPLIHIASHFNLEPGNDTQSYLLTGAGDPITLDLIKQQEGIFSNVDLITLSACETAYSGGKNADGREVDGLSMLAQRQGAKAVIATLWPVADSSTAQLMQQFYKLREKNHLPKVEALRQAQLALLNGAVQGSKEDRERAAIRLKETKTTITAPPYPADPSKPFAHPYYWAPFVLMGNWR